MQTLVPELGALSMRPIMLSAAALLVTVLVIAPIGAIRASLTPAYLALREDHH
jgi:hypothetical protein